MKRKMLFIYNPHAGLARIRSFLLDIIDIFAKAEYEVTVHPTQRQGDAIITTRERSGEFDLVVCSGGDGTLDEVVSGMLQSDTRVPIGYIPAGSTNDFAQSLKIPSDMLQAANTIVSGRLAECDMGKFNSNSFVYVAAFGMFTDVSYMTDQTLKNNLGHLAYVIEGIKRLPQTKAHHMSIEYDGETIEGEFLFGMVSNSVSVGGFNGVTGPNVILNDGLFEVTLVKNPIEMQDFTDLMAALVGGEQDNRFFYNFKAKQLKITSSEEVPWTLDGEYGGMPKVVELENMHCAIKIIVPSGEELPCLI